MDQPITSTADSPPELTANTELAASETRRIESMPKEVGVLLMVAGVGGLLLPGPVGSPFVLMAGVILWPSAFRRVEHWFEASFPTLHRKSVRQIHRFLDDLERRYPLER